MAEQQNNRPNGYKPTQGNTPGVTNDAQKSDYAQRVMPLPPDTTGAGPLAGMARQPDAPRQPEK